jgi:hypothetical protein
MGTRKGGVDISDKYIERTFAETGAKEAQADAPEWVDFSQFLKGRKGDAAAAEKENYHFWDLGRQVWRGEQEADGADYLKAMDNVLDKVQSAMERPKWWAPEISNGEPLLMNVLLPSVGQYK